MIIDLSNEQFLVELNKDPVVSITAHPLSLEEDDNRFLSVIETVDTETGDKSYSIVMPENLTDDERPLWTICVQAAGMVMANLDYLKELGVFDG